MKDKLNVFCDEVCSYLKHATPEEKKEVAQELHDHLEDHTQALIDIGRSEAEACTAALEAMGDAGDIGRELNKQFPLLWLLLSRAFGILCGILVLFLIISPSWLSISHGFNNLQARFASPGSFDLQLDGHKLENYIDIRVEIPTANDIVRFYAADTVENDGRYYAQIASVCYDKWPFGMASDNVHSHIKYYELGKDEPRFSHGGGKGNYGASYKIAQIEVEYGQEYVMAVYDRFGLSLQIEIPLNWEGSYEEQN